MPPRHGITVHSGAGFDYSALTRPSPSLHTTSSTSPSSRSLALTRRAFSTLTKRAKTNVGGVVFIVVLVVCLVGLICIVGLVLVILRNKHARRKREKNLKLQSEGASVPFVGQHQNGNGSPPSMQAHEFRQTSYDPVNTSAVGGGIQELPQDNYLKDGTGNMYPGRGVELQSEEREVPRVQQLDGFVAPPRIGEEPVELPGQGYGGGR